MRDVNGLTRHYDTPLTPQHLTEALQLYISDRAADLLFMTLLSSVHTIPSSAFLMLSQVLPLLVAAVCFLLSALLTALLPCPTHLPYLPVLPALPPFAPMLWLFLFLQPPLLLSLLPLNHPLIASFMFSTNLLTQFVPAGTLSMLTFLNCHTCSKLHKRGETALYEITAEGAGGREGSLLHHCQTSTKQNDECMLEAIQICAQLH